MPPATSPSSRQSKRRYLASDFKRLTNRAPRRFTTPGFTPDSTRTSQAHAREPPNADKAAASNLSTGRRLKNDLGPNATSGFATSDKRASSISSQHSTSSSQAARPSGHAALNVNNIAQHSHADAPIPPTLNHGNVSDSGRRSSPSNSIGCQSSDQFDACVKEDNRGIAQSFLESINASIAPKHEPTVTLNGSSPVDAPVCECCCRCGRGAKAGRPATKKSKSYTNLRTGISELSGWEIEPPVRHEGRPVEKKEHSPGESPLEKLPKEVLDDIIADLALDLPPTDYKPRNVDLISCLLTSKTLHVATISTLYRQITIPHSTIFTKFLLNVNEHPGLGTLVRRLDLSHFTSVGFGRSRQLNAEIQNLTATTLARCIELTPWVQEILLQENLDDDIDVHVLQKIFFGLPKLRAVDFCAASSQPFVQSFTTMMQSFRDSPSTMFGIRRLSLHECFTLPSSAFETLLPRLTQLTHLDVSHTRITDTALKTLPTSARLTHLNLGRCIRISGEGVVDFLTAHPAASTLIYLNLACDISRYRMLWEPDVDRLLPALPTSLRSLNLNGAHIHPHHLRYLLPLTKHLEELGLANADLSLDDINSIFRPPSSRPRSLSPDSMDTDDIWIQPALHYLDLTNIPAITQATLFNTPAPRNLLLTPATLPLEVIELGDKAISSLRECRNTNKRLGWCVKELGRRGWYVREPLHSNINPGNGGSSSVPNSPALHAARTESWVEAVSAAPSNGEAYQRGGKRGWKMGAMWWGMRKCPVAWGEVGGLYGHYMFKK